MSTVGQTRWQAVQQQKTCSYTGRVLPLFTRSPLFLYAETIFFKKWNFFQKTSSIGFFLRHKGADKNFHRWSLFLYSNGRADRPETSTAPYRRICRSAYNCLPVDDRSTIVAGRSGEIIRASIVLSLDPASLSCIGFGALVRSTR